MPTGLGSFIHEPIMTASEPEHRPPPASRLPSWATSTNNTCTDADCESHIEGFAHRHVRGFPLAEYERVDE